MEDEMVKVQVKKKTLDKLINLFGEEKKKPLKTRQSILRFIDLKMKENLNDEKIAIKRVNYSEALICENYFFALFFLREDILGKSLNVHKERKRLLATPSKEETKQ